jgi:glycosyltransferase involved in cell wall biosynthesis
MKILHLLQSPNFSGAENVVCQIINMFKSDEEFDFVYCSCDGPIRDALSERNIRFVPMDEFSISNIKEIIWKEKPDIIHAHDMRASFAAACVCGSIPLISHIHNNNFDSRGLSLKAIAYLRAGLKAKHIFWVSKSSFTGYAFHSILKKKSDVLYNIMDINEIHRRAELDENSYNYDVIYLGRLVPPKNPYRLLDVCKLLVEKMKDVQIAIVGTGEMEFEVKNKAEQMGLLNNVSFLGYQTNPYKILKDSKVMLMTSLWEGTPMCAIEAMALGTPIVSTPVDGLKDLITNDENGYLTDDNSELANQICELIVNQVKLDEMVQNAITFSNSYNDIEAYRSKIKCVYHEAISSNHKELR